MTGPGVVTEWSFEILLRKDLVAVVTSGVIQKIGLAVEVIFEAILTKGLAVGAISEETLMRGLEVAVGCVTVLVASTALTALVVLTVPTARTPLA